jgi:hypothetical protein
MPPPPRKRKRKNKTVEEVPDALQIPVDPTGIKRIMYHGGRHSFESNDQVKESLPKAEILTFRFTANMAGSGTPVDMGTSLQPESPKSTPCLGSFPTEVQLKD